MGNPARVINATREPGKPELRHDSFMAKVPSVIGETLAPKFYGTNKYASGKGVVQERRIYNFPKREAMLMAMLFPEREATLQAPSHCV